MFFKLFSDKKVETQMPKKPDVQKVTYSYNFLMSVSTFVMGIDDEIQKQKIPVNVVLEISGDKWDTPPDYLVSDFIFRYLRRHWESKVLLNQSDDSTIAICNFKDLNYRHMIPYASNKFCNPTIENIGFELFFCIKKIVDFFKYSLVSISVGKEFTYRTITALDQQKTDAYTRSIICRFVESFYFQEMNKVNLRNRDNA